MKFGRYEEKEIDEPFYRARANRQKRVRFFFARKIVRNSWRAFQKKMAVSGQSSTQSQRRFQFKVKRKKNVRLSIIHQPPLPLPFLHLRAKTTLWRHRVHFSNGRLSASKKNRFSTLKEIIKKNYSDSIEEEYLVRPSNKVNHRSQRNTSTIHCVAYTSLWGIYLIVSHILHRATYQPIITNNDPNTISIIDHR